MLIILNYYFRGPPEPVCTRVLVLVRKVPVKVPVKANKILVKANKVLVKANIILVKLMSKYEVKLNSRYQNSMSRLMSKQIQNSCQIKKLIQVKNKMIRITVINEHCLIKVIKSSVIYPVLLNNFLLSSKMPVLFVDIRQRVELYTIFFKRWHWGQSTILLFQGVATLVAAGSWGWLEDLGGGGWSGKWFQGFRTVMTTTLAESLVTKSLNVVISNSTKEHVLIHHINSHVMNEVAEASSCQKDVHDAKANVHTHDVDAQLFTPTLLLGNNGFNTHDHTADTPNNVHGEHKATIDLCIIHIAQTYTMRDSCKLRDPQVYLHLCCQCLLYCLHYTPSVLERPRPVPDQAQTASP